MDTKAVDRIGITGGGVTGLVAAWRLARLGLRVVLFEKSDRLGGVIRTVAHDGWLREIGPNSFTSSPHTDALIAELGLNGVTLRTPLKEHDRFVWKAGSLRRVPTGPGQLMTTDVLTFSEKIRLLRGLFGRYERPIEDQSLADFFGRVIGPGAVDSLLRPFLAGIYAADADRVSFEATFNRLWLAVRKHDRLIAAVKSLRGPNAGPRVPKALVSFHQGLQVLATTLEARLREAGVAIHLGHEPTIERDGNGWIIRSAGMEPVACHQVAITSSAEGAATLLRRWAPEAAEWLDSIEYAALTVAHVGAHEADFADQRRGFGFLTVADQGVEALGMIWNDRIFPGRTPADHRLMTCFYGGEKRPAANDLSDHELRRIIKADLRTVLGHCGGELPLLEITRWRRALPVFRLGHRRRQEQALAGIPAGIHLAGNYLGGVSIPDRVEAANTLAEAIEGAAKR